MLRVRDLERSFGDRTAVDGLSFDVAAGETYGLLGPNGSGKTTTISMICGILRSDSGIVELDGRSIDHRTRDAKRDLGLVPQELAVYADLTARENLRFFGRIQGLAGSELDTAIDRVLEVVALTDRADDLSREFSGGMQRRLNIAVGLLHGPKLLILDEPTVGVDPQSRNQILDAVDALGGEGLAVIYTTHYMEEAERLCDRIGIIDAGRLLAEGTRAELVAGLGDAARVRIDLADGAGDAVVSAVRGVDGVGSADLSGATLDVVTERPNAVIAPVIVAATDAGASVAGVAVDQADLESVFLDLTGRALRD